MPSDQGLVRSHLCSMCRVKPCTKYLEVMFVSEQREDFPFGIVQISVYYVSQDDFTVLSPILCCGKALPEKCSYLCSFCQIPTTWMSRWVLEGVPLVFSITSVLVIPGLMLRCHSFSRCYIFFTLESLKLLFQFIQKKFYSNRFYSLKSIPGKINSVYENLC